MVSPGGRIAANFARLRYFLPAVVLTLATGFVEHPAVLVALLLAQPLYVAGAVSALGYLLEPDFGTLVLRRGSAFLVLLSAYAAFVALVLGTPAVWLAREATPAHALLLSLGVAIAVASLWRIWPAFGRLFVGDDAYPEPGAEAGSWLVAAQRRALAFATHLGRERDPYFARGLPVALALLVMVAGAMGLAGLGNMLPFELRLSALWAYAIVACPLAATIIARASERLLLDDAVDDADDAAASAADETPVLAPADAETRDTQLQRAAATGHVALALALLDAGARADRLPAAEARDQRSLLMHAATCADPRLMRALIAKGADVNRAVGGLTPLLAATRDSHQGRPDAVMTLVANGADPRTTDAEGNTPLHYAALSCEAAVAAILVDAGAELDVANRDGATPLGAACASGNATLARYLLDRGAKPDVARAQPALIAAAAAADDHPALAKLLLKHKATVDATDRLGRTALHAAALHGHAGFAEVLLAAGAGAGARDGHGVSPLMDAARGGSNKVIALLRTRRPDPDCVDAQGRSALVIACQSLRADDETVRLLLALGADATLATREGRGAIEYAVAAGRWGAVALIDPAFPLPSAVDDVHVGVFAPEGASRLELVCGAIAHGRLAIADELLRLRPALTEPELLVAARAALGVQDPGALELVLRHGLSPDAREAGGASLIELAAASRPVAAVQLERLFERGVQPGGTRVLVALGDSAAAAACVAEPYALLALERGADPWGLDESGRTLLHRALAHRQYALFDALLARGLDPNAADARGRTPLHELAALPESDSIALARALLRAGADPERAARDGQTPLGAALAAGRAAFAHELTWSHGFRHPGRRLLPQDLPAAAALGDAAAVERLLAIGLPIDGRDAQGATALLRACGAGHGALAALLLARGADATLAAATGATALSAAISAQRVPIVALLLDHGVVADQPLSGGSTPLMVAAALGFDPIAALLLARGADAQARDEHGNGALHAAAQHAFASGDAGAGSLLERLAAADAGFDSANAQGDTPLLLLLGAGTAPGAPPRQRELPALAQALLARGADPDAQDSRGVSCLHAAAMHGRLDVCELLLRAGADPERRDRLGRSAHDIALMLGYADVGAALKRSAARQTAHENAR
ncbi:MAG TPA: ankyrin repeat domain-containing protein [Candidatus Saccharimonadia bacterium]|nr:ankyrin repeat domain-containing protein [Candidatus Saccharimonadia bacterium]